MCDQVLFACAYILCASVCQPSVAENLAGGVNAPVVCCDLNTGSCSALGWGNTWHHQVLHYSGEILNAPNHILAAPPLWDGVYEGKHLFLWTRMGRVFVSTRCCVCVCVSWLVLLCVFVGEEIIKFTGKKNMADGLGETAFPAKSLHLFYLVWWVNQLAGGFASANLMSGELSLTERHVNMSHVHVK